MNTVVILTSGDIKSAAATARYQGDHSIVLLHTNYGQRAAKAQLEAIQALADWCSDARVVALDLPHLIQLQKQVEVSADQQDITSALGVVGTDVLLPGSTRALLPLVFSVGAQCAMRVGASKLITGLSRQIDASHLGLSNSQNTQTDTCREFIHGFNVALKPLSTKHLSLMIEAPLIDLSYPEIVMLALKFDVPLEATWSCDRPGPKPCHRCEPCATRANAFAKLGQPDPALATVSV